MPFELELIPKISSWLKGTEQVEKSINEMADSLEDLAKESGADSEKAAKSLAADYEQAFEKRAQYAKKSSTDIVKSDRDIEKSAQEAGREIADSGREAAQSFTGDIGDLADFVQESLVNSLKELGPAGLAAGIAAAAGVGLIQGQLETAAEKITEARRATIDLAKAIAEVGDPQALDWAEKLSESLTEITDSKEWFEIWQDVPRTRLESWTKASDQLGISLDMMAKAWAGDAASAQALTDELNRQRQALLSQTEIVVSADASFTQLTASAQSQLLVIDETISAFETQALTLKDSTALAEDLASATNSLTQANEDSLPAALELADALTLESAASALAAEANEDFAAATVAALNQAAQAWSQYADDTGDVDFTAYTDGLKTQQQTIKDFEKDLATASKTLSAEALAYIKSMGPDASELLSSFLAAPKSQQADANAVWTDLGKSTSDAYGKAADLAAETKKNLQAAQKTADANAVEARLELDASSFAQQINRQIAANQNKTIYVNIKPKGELP